MLFTSQASAVFRLCAYYFHGSVVTPWITHHRSHVRAAQGAWAASSRLGREQPSSSAGATVPGPPIHFFKMISVNHRIIKTR